MTKDEHVRSKIFNNQPFRESAVDELKKREGAGTLFVQSIKDKMYHNKSIFFYLNAKKFEKKHRHHQQNSDVSIVTVTAFLPVSTIKPVQSDHVLVQAKAVFVDKWSLLAGPIH